MYIEHVSTVDGEHKPSSVFGFNQEIRISFVLVSNNKVSDEILSVALQDKYGNRIFTIHKPLDQLARHENRIRGSMLIPKEFIAPNIYSFHFAIVRSDGKVLTSMKANAVSGLLIQEHHSHNMKVRIMEILLFHANGSQYKINIKQFKPV